MPKLRQLGLQIAVFLLATAPGFAAEVAVLRNGFSIRCERRSRVGEVTRLYTGPEAANYVDIPNVSIDHFEPDSSLPQPIRPESAPQPAKRSSIDEIVADASDTQKIDPDFIKSVIKAESGFNTRAVSPKGAQGLMQLMPATASELGISNSFDPEANVNGGTRYLRFLLEKYNYDAIKALAAYNAGPESVDRYGGLPPYYETQTYVTRIIKDYNQKKMAATAEAGKSRSLGSAIKQNRPNSQPVR